MSLHPERIHPWCLPPLLPSTTLWACSHRISRPKENHWKVCHHHIGSENCRTSIQSMVVVRVRTMSSNRCRNMCRFDGEVSKGLLRPAPSSLNRPQRLSPAPVKEKSATHNLPIRLEPMLNASRQLCMIRQASPRALHQAAQSASRCHVGVATTTSVMSGGVAKAEAEGNMP